MLAYVLIGGLVGYVYDQLTEKELVGGALPQ
jgi:hypothetical protein